MANFWTIVNKVIRDSDILLVVLDSRLIDETRNPEIEQKIGEAEKEIIYVLNKSDLADKKKLEHIKDEFENCVFMSAKKHQGTSILRSEILRISKGEKVTVGVLGYPNTGKSSVINALAGGGAKVAPKPGQTTGIQILRASEKIYLLDTPGVFPFQEQDETKHLLIGSKDPSKAKDPETSAETLLENNKEKLHEWYGIDTNSTDTKSYDLESVAIKLNFLKKGGKPDTRRAAVKILHDWQKGKII